MNFFLTDAETKEKQRIKALMQSVRAGASLKTLKPEDVTLMQEYALDEKDLQLYDYLDSFWKTV